MTPERNAKDCRWIRLPADGERGLGSAGTAFCDFVGTVDGLKPAPVDAATCDHCCRCPTTPEAWNPVIASLVYAATGESLQSGSHSATTHTGLIEARQFAKSRLHSLGRESNGGTGGDRVTAKRSAAERHFKKPAATHPQSKIGLVGRNSDAGLGSINRDLVRQLGIDFWLVPRLGPAAKDPPPSDSGCRLDVIESPPGRERLIRWLDQIDVLLFVETPYWSPLPRLARDRGIPVVCVPMWEWLHPAIEWLSDVDLLICPTRWTCQLLEQWRKQYHFCWNLAYVPWPIDCEQFLYRKRDRCREIVFINGTGGAPGFTLDGRPLKGGRKNVALLAQAALLVPEVPIRLYSQSGNLPPLPANVRVMNAPANNRDLYREGDVCLVLSRWEGLGLQSLECQAAGMPLIAPHHPPMDEPDPWKLIPCEGQEPVWISRERMIAVPKISATEVAAQLRQAFESDIAEASESSRRYVTRNHDWNRQGQTILQLLSATKVRPPRHDP